MRGTKGNTLVVSVEFHGVQRKLTREDQIRVPVSENATIKDVINYLRGKYPELQLNQSGVMVSVNERILPMDHVLESNDRITLLPPIGGG
ncbi:MAG: MoaD/ThiS family protein [Deltaproteobacteria bacterium]|nr:MoaD/ThiS family protein [Deltaproteobacteria bacterium]